MDIPYELKRKKVKNIIIKIRREDGMVMISAPLRVPVKEIERILSEKKAWILSAQEKVALHQTDRQEWLQGKGLPADQDILKETEEIISSYLEALSFWQIEHPQEIRLRTMKTLWGSCHHTKKIITLNRILFLAPRECREYVILHELAHLAWPNHGKGFYHLLDQVQPDHRLRRRRLKELGLL